MLSSRFIRSTHRTGTLITVANQYPRWVTRRQLADRVLDVALKLASRIDPTVVGAHAVRTYLPSWSAGPRAIEDECVPPDRVLIGNPVGYPQNGLRSVNPPAWRQ